MTSNTGMCLYALPPSQSIVSHTWQASCARPRAIPLSCCSKELGHHFAVSCSEKGSLKAVTSWCRQHRHDPVDAQQEAANKSNLGRTCWESFSRSDMMDSRTLSGRFERCA